MPQCRLFPTVRGACGLSNYGRAKNVFIGSRGLGGSQVALNWHVGEFE